MNIPKYKIWFITKENSQSTNVGKCDWRDTHLWLSGALLSKCLGMFLDNLKHQINDANCHTIAVVLDFQPLKTIHTRFDQQGF